MTVTRGIDDTVGVLRIPKHIRQLLRHGDKVLFLGKRIYRNNDAHKEIIKENKHRSHAARYVFKSRLRRRQQICRDPFLQSRRHLFNDGLQTVAETAFGGREFVDTIDQRIYERYDLLCEIDDGFQHGRYDHQAKHDDHRDRKRYHNRNGKVFCQPVRLRARLFAFRLHESCPEQTLEVNDRGVKHIRDRNTVNDGRYVSEILVRHRDNTVKPPQRKEDNNGDDKRCDYSLVTFQTVFSFVGYHVHIAPLLQTGIIFRLPLFSCLFL